MFFASSEEEKGRMDEVSGGETVAVVFMEYIGWLISSRKDVVACCRCYDKSERCEDKRNAKREIGFVVGSKPHICHEKIHTE